MVEQANQSNTLTERIISARSSLDFTLTYGNIYIQMKNIKLFKTG